MIFTPLHGSMGQFQRRSTLCWLHMSLVFGSAIRGAWLNGNTPSNSILIRYAAYPSLLAGGYLLYTWLVATASPILFSAYLTVLVAGIGIFLHETFAPNREDWRPDTDDLIHDGVFLTLVQIALPALLKGLALVLIVTLAHNGGAPFDGFWPHTTPTILQVALMLFVAEFFRYWLHRTFHRNRGFVEVARRTSRSREALHDQCRPISSARQSVAISRGYAALPAAGGLRRCLRSLLRAVCHQRILSAFQLRRQVGILKLDHRRAGTSPVASFCKNFRSPFQLRQQSHHLGRNFWYPFSAARQTGWSNWYRQ